MYCDIIQRKAIRLIISSFHLITRYVKWSRVNILYSFVRPLALNAIELECNPRLQLNIKRKERVSYRKWEAFGGKIVHFYFLEKISLVPIQAKDSKCVLCLYTCLTLVCLCPLVDRDNIIIVNRGSYHIRHSHKVYLQRIFNTSGFHCCRDGKDYYLKTRWRSSKNCYANQTFYHVCYKHQLTWNGYKYFLKVLSHVFLTWNLRNM